MGFFSTKNILGPTKNTFGGVFGIGANASNKNISNARNAMEVAEAQKARDFSKTEAQTNRDFQASQVLQKMDYDERLSSTAVQRRMEDMKNAGINPILAGKYDASTPAAAAASGGIGSTAKANAHGYEYKRTVDLNALSSAMDLRIKDAQRKNIIAQTNKTGIESEVIGAGLPAKNAGKALWDPIAKDIINFSDWAKSYQTDAKNGKGLLDKADNFIDESIKKGKDWWYDKQGHPHITIRGK